MADPHQRPSMTESYGILGITKSATIKDMCRAYKYLVMKWHPDTNPSNKDEAQSKFQEINEAYKAINENKINETLQSSREPIISSPGGYNHHKSMDESFFTKSSTLLRSLSRKSRTPTTSPTSLSKSASRRSRSPTPVDTPGGLAGGSQWSASAGAEIPLVLLRSVSRMSPTNHIIYSQSSPRRKAPPIEKKLECTLEELCDGCVKQIMMTRDVIRNGMIEQEGELVNIIVNPGWKKGTKITFEGKGDERPGYSPADIVFIIDEKAHPLFKREGDGLEYEAEISLVQALTGCTISIPLLGGEKMSLSFDIIYPGYIKVIRGQGMPISKELGKRGDLRIKFFIDFPSELSSDQRSLASSILQDCCK